MVIEVEIDVMLLQAKECYGLLVNHQNAESQRQILSYGFQGKQGGADISILDFKLPEVWDINVSSLSHPVCGPLLW